MKITRNNFGETVYKWENNIHPDNADFAQIVFWKAYHKADNRYSIGYALEPVGKIKWVLFGTGDILPVIKKLQRL